MCFVALQHGSVDAIREDELLEERPRGPSDLLHISGWRTVVSKSMTCTQTIESTHPYAANMEMLQSVSFPGASQIALFFDMKCSTERKYDVLTVYKDAFSKEIWGDMGGYSGSTGWPGTDGKRPILIPSDHCCLHFKSDGSRQDWGFKVVAIAPVCKESMMMLKDEFIGVSTFIVETALMRANNHVVQAREFLVTDMSTLLAEEEAAIRLRDVNSNVSRGLFKDPSGSLQVK